MREDYRVLCLECGRVEEQVYYGAPSIIVALLLALFFVIPAIIYWIVCSSREYWGCAYCESSRIIGLSSPVAKEVLAKREAQVS
jgi:hypothetical protein